MEIIIIELILVVAAIEFDTKTCQFDSQGDDEQQHAHLQLLTALPCFHE